jgi:hypothetical protein
MLTRILNLHSPPHDPQIASQNIDLDKILQGNKVVVIEAGDFEATNQLPLLTFTIDGKRENKIVLTSVL